MSNQVTGRVFILENRNQLETVRMMGGTPQVMQIEPNLSVGNTIVLNRVSVERTDASRESFEIIHVENTDNIDNAQVDYYVIPIT